MRFSFYSKQYGPGLLLLILIAIVFALLAMADKYLGTDLLIVRYIAFAVLAYFAIFAWKYITKYSFEQGLNGEYEVSEILKQLPAGYHLIYDFQYGKSGNTDMIVVGPTGIWTIEVKNFKKQSITVNNDQLLGDGYSLENERRQAYREAENLQEYLKSIQLFFPVNPILVFADPKTQIDLGDNHFKGVSVLEINQILEFIQNHNKDERFTPEICSKLRDEIKKQTSII